MAMTGHKTTQMVRRYIKEANIFKNNALNKIKNLITQKSIIRPKFGLFEGLIFEGLKQILSLF